MTWVYEVLEVCDKRGTPSGKFRLVRYADVAPEAAEALCGHNHATPAEALACQQANQVLDYEFRERPSAAKSN